MLYKLSFQPFFSCRNIQAILKSPDLDSKYSKFATASASASSPKVGRRKFLLSRNSHYKRNKRKSPSKTREGTTGSSSSSTANSGPAAAASAAAASGQAEGGGLGIVGSGLLPSLNQANDFPGAPVEVANKYVVGEVIGDGECCFFAEKKDL